MNLEDIGLYLPKYLSEASRNALRDALKNFSEKGSNSQSNFYTDAVQDKPILFQGDGLKDLLFVFFPSEQTMVRQGMLLSNTCDMSEENNRLSPINLVYAQMTTVGRYRQVLLEEQVSEQKVDAHIDDLKRQGITTMFYLPAIKDVLEESIVFFDRICNVERDYFKVDDIKGRRLFTLGNFGHYLLLFKLSFHFSRIQEKVDRDEGVIQ